MAADASKLAGYISAEIVAEFKLEKSNQQLDQYAAALSRAVTKFLLNDVQTAAGQGVAGQGSGTDSAGDTVTTEVTSKVTTKGKLI